MKRLIMFHGEECPHCHKMMPLVNRLEKDKKIKVIKLEVWYDKKNSELMDKLSKGKCQAVPYFFNEKTRKSICGSASYEKLAELLN